MATATMGLRRRVQVGSSPSGSGGKRSRSENNNSPSQGNLNSLGEPASKKSRSSSGRDTRSATKAKEMEKKVPHGPPHWADPRPYASIAGLSLNAQQALCQAEAAAGLPSPMAYLASTTMATFVGNAASSLGKSPAVSYLDISNMTARPPGGWASEAEAKSALGQLFSSGSLAAVSSAFSSSASSCSEASVEEKKEAAPAQQQQQISLPKNFPNDSMFNAYQPWVIKTYGDLAKTKTITIKKYARILRTLRGEEVNSAENSKFRFWVKSKGFHIGQPEGYEPKPADRIVGRHAVTNPGLDPPLYVPTQPPHNKTLNGAEGTVPPGRVYKKVAIVENFFDIIHAVHVDLEGRPGKHAGQKRTYRTITETYAFLPREAVTRFLLGCTECQRRPRTPSPTASLTATPTPATTPPPPTEKPASPKPATALSSEKEDADDEKPREASHAPPDPDSIVLLDDVKEELEEPVKEEPKTAAVEAASAPASTATVSTSQPTRAETISSSSSSSSKPKMLTRDEKYNPLSITNLLRKDPPVTRRPIPIIQHLPEPQIPEQQPQMPAASSDQSTVTSSATVTTSSPVTSSDSIVSTTSAAVPKKMRMLSGSHRSTPSPMAMQPWSPSHKPKSSGQDYALPFVGASFLSLQQQQLVAAAQQRQAEERARAKESSRASSGSESDSDEEPDFSPAAGLIDTNLNLLATIQQLHCQVMLALTERLRPAAPASPTAPAACSSSSGSDGNDS